MPKEIALKKAAVILASGGTLAIFWSAGRAPESETRARIDAAYRQHAPAMPHWEKRADPGYRAHDIEAALEDDAAFERPWKRRYGWSQAYTTSQYLELLQTHSDHQLLPALERDALLGAVGRAIDDGGGSYTLEYETQLFAAFRRA